MHRLCASCSHNHGTAPTVSGIGYHEPAMSPPSDFKSVTRSTAPLGSIVVQHVRVLWTKKSRGAPEAIARNSLPRALPLCPADGRCVYQSHVFSERNTHFSHTLHEEYASDLIPQHFGALWLQMR